MPPAKRAPRDPQRKLLASAADAAPSARPSEPPSSKRPAKPASSGAAILGFEQKLWEAADKLRGSMDPGEYKHVVLGLIFLKYISDAFDEEQIKKNLKGLGYAG